MPGDIPSSNDIGGKIGLLTAAFGLLTAIAVFVKGHFTQHQRIVEIKLEQVRTNTKLDEIIKLLSPLVQKRRDDEQAEKQEALAEYIIEKIQKSARRGEHGA